MKMRSVPISEVSARGSWSALDHVYPRPWSVVDAMTGKHIITIPESERYREACQRAKQVARSAFATVVLIDGDGEVMKRYTVSVSVRDIT